MRTPSPSRISRLHSLTLTSAWAALLVGAAACSDDTTDRGETPASALELQAQAILDAHLAQQEFPGAVMALHDPARGDALVTTGTSRPAPDGAAVDPNVPWVIGSATKTFVAVVVLQLAEEGKVDLDASIAPYFPTLPRASEISVRELLQHTSGLNEYLDSEAVLADTRRSWSPAELIDVAVARGPVGEPGGAHHYANTNYIVLGELVRQLTGHPWYEAVHQRVLGPLEMRRTAFVGEPSAPAMGPGYGIEDGHFVEYTTRYDASLGGAAGALQSTAPDLLHFARALLEGSLLDTPQQNAMQAFVPGEPRGYVEHEYGLGFERYAVNDLAVYGHAGSAPAHASFLGFDPESGISVAVVINSEEPAPAPFMALEVLAALTNKDVSPPPGAE